jgi:DNA-binding response OmpR family regulator
MPARTLVIEDDERIARLLEHLLSAGGYDVQVAREGRGGLRKAHTSRPDVIVLDVGLPDLEGWEVLDRLRDISEVPILMLTGRGSSSDKVRGLRGGADDYLTKPFDNGELLARIEALLRRRRNADEEDEAEDVLVADDLSIDVAGGSVTVGERECTLTPIELRLLTALVRHRGQVLSPTQLLDLAWSDPSGISPDRVKFSVHRLRRKLDWSSDDSPIEAVRGFGYRYRRPTHA